MRTRLDPWTLSQLQVKGYSGEKFQELGYLQWDAESPMLEEHKSGLAARSKMHRITSVPVGDGTPWALAMFPCPGQ